MRLRITKDGYTVIGWSISYQTKARIKSLLPALHRQPQPTLTHCHVLEFPQPPLPRVFFTSDLFHQAALAR